MLLRFAVRCIGKFSAYLWEIKIHFHNFALNIQFSFSHILCNTFIEPAYACMCTNTTTYNDSSYGQLYAALVANHPPSMH